MNQSGFNAETEFNSETECQQTQDDEIYRHLQTNSLNCPKRHSKIKMLRARGHDMRRQLVLMWYGTTVYDMV